ncbi:PTS sugar transporter subunit IIA [Aerococcaceae bacterium DSM 111020]|nr:PTS sugar transporter subunit IIA [Aerococcaceae bacterium DSM 111020]
MLRDLIYKDTIYISDGGDLEKVLYPIVENLTEKNLVHTDFLNNLLLRESNYPTALDLSPINKKYHNIAIPHTESEYVNDSRIIIVQLRKPIKMNNMINPEETLEVKMLFMLLNNNPEKQASLLADVMDFFNQMPEDKIMELFNSSNIEEILSILNAKI